MKTTRLAFGALAFCGVLVFAVAGCDSAGTFEDDPPPPLPPEAFTLETDIFEDAPAGKASAEYEHFVNAALRVWPVSLVLKTSLLIPYTLTAAALQAEPQLTGGAWVWSSQIATGDGPAVFSLSARPEGDRLEWQMRVSYTDGATGVRHEDFVLYTAETRPNDDSGSWDLFYPVDGTRTHALEADFEVHGEDDKEITFRVPLTAREHAGSLVRYAEEDGEHRFFWREADADREHLVTWNPVTKTGSITATNYNGGARACWDASLRNADCP